MNGKHVRLSCEQCKTRKKRCDKVIPCSACLKAGIECTAVQRQRLPRGRSGNQKLGKAAIRDKVARLDKIISQLHQSGHVAPVKTTTTTGERDQNSADLQPIGDEANEDETTESLSSPTPGRFVAPEFWMNLSEAVEGLRDVLEDVDAEVEEERNESNLEPKRDSHCLLFGPNAVVNSYQSPSKSFHEQIFEVYEQRFDAIFKILHWPTACSLVRDKTSSAGPEKIATLEAAILFGGVCTLFADEIDNKKDLVDQCRHDVEKALVKAHLLTTTSIVVLQAFVIYLAGLRTCSANAQQWSLLALAVRLATSQGMPSNLQIDGHTTETKLRRRLWLCLGMLDLQSAFDRGSKPLLSVGDFDLLLLDKSDEELSNALVLGSSNDADDMTFFLLSVRAMYCQRRLTDASVSWAEQLGTIADFERLVGQLAGSCHSPSATPLQRFTLAVAHESLLAMNLLLRRPLRRTPQHFQPVQDDFDVLSAATELLESAQFKRSPGFSLWSWYKWTKWYALAIVLAEICSRARDDKVERAWSTAQVEYDRYAQLVADAEGGLLWKPISKLMRRAEINFRASSKGSGNCEAMLEVDETTTWQQHNADFDIGVVEFSNDQKDPFFLCMDTQQNGDHPMNTTQPSHTISTPSTDDLEALSWFQWDLFMEDLQNQSAV